MNMNSISDPTYRTTDEQLCKAYEMVANNRMMRLLLLLQYTKVESLQHMLNLMAPGKTVAIHLQMVL